MEKTEKDSSHDDPVQVKAAKDYQAKEKDHTSEESYQDISMLQKAETEIIKMCQARHFWKEMKQSMLEIGCQVQAVFINYIHSSTKMVSSEWVEDL